MAQTRATPDHVDRMTERHGWMRERLQLIEAALWGRWSYWIATCLNGRLGPLPEWSIPQLAFGPLTRGRRLQHPDATLCEMVGDAEDARRQTFRAFERALRSGGSVGDLFRWWLYAFGSPSVVERPPLTDEAKVAMYSDLDVGRMLGHPADWAAEICLEFLGTDSRSGWFPTPVEVADLMARMTFHEREGDTRALSVHDPCVGTGVMLLVASNFSLNLSGQDISATMCAACEFNGWLFMPWLVWGKRMVRELREQTGPAVAPEPESATGAPIRSDPVVPCTSDAPSRRGVVVQGSLFEAF